MGFKLRRVMTITLAMFATAIGPNICGQSEASEPARIWVDHSGGFSVKARLLQRDGDLITLEREDGGTATLRLDQLSEADVVYLDELERQKDATIPSGLRAPLKPRPDPLPVLALEPANESAAEGSLLNMSPAYVVAPSEETPVALPADPSPFEIRVRPGRIKMGKVDVYDICSRPIELASQQHGESHRSEPQNLIAMSFSEGIGQPGAAVRGLMILFDIDRQRLYPIWQANQSLKLFDHHSSSGRGLALTGFDSLGKGGALVVVDGLSQKRPRFLKSRRLTEAVEVGGGAHLRWARWVDAEHFVAVIDEKIGMWNIISGEQIYGLSEIDPRSVPALSGGRRYLAVPTRGGTRFYRTGDGAALGTARVPSNDIPGVAFSPAGDALAIVTSRSLIGWELTSATFSGEVKVRHSIGRRSPVWINDDLLLSSSGVLVSRYRGKPIWRYEMPGVTTVGMRGAATSMRRDPVSELVTSEFPHAAAAEEIQRMDRSPDVMTRQVLRRSRWVDGRWVDSERK